MKHFLIVTLFCALFCGTALYAQIVPLGGGCSVGLGSFSSTTPSVTSYMLSGYADIKYTTLPGVYFKLKGFYSRDINILFPENRTGKYYPYIYGGSLTAITSEALSDAFSLEYGGGAVVLRDKTFSDYENVDPGVQLNAELLLTIGHFTASKLQLGASAEYGQTFGKTTPAYLFWALDVRYAVL